MNKPAQVISIKKFLSQNTETDQTLMHVVRILVQGIGQHAVAGDADDCTRFRERIKEVSDVLVDGISPAELLVRAGSVLNGLEDHNRRTIRHQRLQTAELQNMVKMLTSTVGIISALSNANVGRLGEIEEQVATVSELEDVRIIKAKLSDCLDDIRKEVERQRSETGETIEQLSQGLDQARKRAERVRDGEPQDVVTGLALRAEAESTLAQSAREGFNSYAAVMVLDRLPILNQKFGREAGDEILVAFTRMVQRALKPEDLLFRWGGPALLALLPRQSSSLERVRAEVARVMESRFEHTIETPSRSILVPIAARWTLLPMMAAPRLIYQKIDAFAAQPSARD